MLRARLKKEAGVRYFDTALHPILAGGEVVGIGVMAKDITAQREREARFTELFETLQEGVYFTTPEGCVLDCNMALVRLLGYARFHPDAARVFRRLEDFLAGDHLAEQFLEFGRRHRNLIALSCAR